MAGRGSLFVDSSPAKYEEWLGRAVRRTRDRFRGDERIDRYINVWAPKQIESYLAFKKAVRDNLQVDAIYCSLDYKRSLENFLDVLSHQYGEGYMPHWFRPLVTYRYSDKPAWIPLTLAELTELQSQAGQITIPSHVYRGIADIRRELNKKNILASDRRLWRGAG